MGWRLGIVLALCGALLAGCGGGAGSGSAGTGGGSASAAPQSAGAGGTPRPAGSGRANVCDLIDRPAAATFFALPTGIHFQSRTNCRLRAGAADLSVTVSTPQVRADYDTARAARADAVDVAGIGEVADYSAKTATLTFFKGNTITSVQLIGSGFDPAAVRAFIEAQARFADGVR